VPDRTKRIFISDIHLTYDRSMNAPNPFGGFKKNIPILAQFLDDQLKSPDVKELVILGDLFDTWIIPTTYLPIKSFDRIIANKENKPVIDKLIALAASKDIKLAYVPGNHDMSMSAGDIPGTKNFLETNFPGIRFFSDNDVPLGSFNVGTLVAEHGNRYCLFNGPDLWTNSNSFLPLGYFISRIVSYKVLKTGLEQDPREIFFKFLREFMTKPDFIGNMLNAIASDAGLNPKSKIKLGVPGYPDALSVEEIGNKYKDLCLNWEKSPGNINVPTAIFSDLGNLSFAASLAYFMQIGSKIDIVIFGHTHIPAMNNPAKNTPTSGGDISIPGEIPSGYIYANSGTWVDKSQYGCTFVETEEVPNERRHYVRIKGYPGNNVVNGYEGFVEV